jgi:amidase
MAATVDGLITGMRLLEPGFTVAGAPARTIGRLRTSGRPEIEEAIDRALKMAEFEVVALDWDGFEAGTSIFTTIFLAEAWETDHALAAAHPDDVGQDIAQLLAMNDMFRPGLADARAQLGSWRQSLLDLFAQAELLALPTMPVFPPRLEDLTPDSLVDIVIQTSQYTGLFNAAGVPCTAQPVRAMGTRIPASLQLVGPLRGEELLLATALRIEAALA